MIYAPIQNKRIKLFAERKHVTSKKTLAAIAVTVLLASCEKPNVRESALPFQDSPKMTEDEAITYLLERGNDVSKADNGTTVMLDTHTLSQEVTIEDIEAVNALNNVVEFRIIASWGVAPEVFEKLRVFPEVRLVAVHYQMPAETLAHFDRFPNVEEMLFWADHFVSCDHLPPLQGLRILHHESTEGDFTPESVRRIAACKNLEEIEILRPLNASEIDLLTTLPKLRHLEVNGTVILNNGEQGAAGQPATPPRIGD